MGSDSEYPPQSEGNETTTGLQQTISYAGADFETLGTLQDQALRFLSENSYGQQAQVHQVEPKAFADCARCDSYVGTPSNSQPPSSVATPRAGGRTGTWELAAPARSQSFGGLPCVSRGRANS